MRTVLTSLTTAALFTCRVWAQTSTGSGVDQTFFLNQASTPQDLIDIPSMLQRVVDARVVRVDPQRKAVVLQGTPDQMMLADWLVRQTDPPAAGQTPTPEYPMAGANAGAVRLFRMEPAATAADMTELGTTIQVLAGVQRVFGIESSKTIAVRGSVTSLDTAEWIFHQLSPAGQMPGVDSPAFPTPSNGPPEGDDIVVRVLRLDPSTARAKLVAISTAIKVVTDVQRVLPNGASRALAIRGSSDRVAAAAWVVHQLNKPAGAVPTAGAHEFQIPGLPNGVVCLFFLAHPGSAEDLTSLASQIRARTAMDLFVLSDFGAVIVRGRPDRIVTAGAMVALFDAAVR